PPCRPGDRGRGGAQECRDHRARCAAPAPPHPEERHLRQDGRLRAQERALSRDGGGSSPGSVSVYARAAAGFAWVFVAIGIVLIVQTARLGGGIGYLLGLLFVAAGAGRLYLLKRRTRR